VRTSWDKTLLPRKTVSTYVRHPPHSVPIASLGSVQRYAALQSRPPDQGVKRASPLGVPFSTPINSLLQELESPIGSLEQGSVGSFHDSQGEINKPTYSLTTSRQRPIYARYRRLAGPDWLLPLPRAGGNAIEAHIILE
jgi:hypothetical protein